MQSTHSSRLRQWGDSIVSSLLKLLMIAGGVIALLAFLVTTVTEQYFAPAPAIGTRFSANYSDANFDRIQRGMTAADVIELVGEPLNKDRMIASFAQGSRSDSMPDGSTAMWSYSADNPGGIWDVAWLGRFVYFDNAGYVTGTMKWVFYD